MEYLEIIPRRFSAKFIIEGIKLILNSNTFTFKDVTYLQIKGTAMGTKMAPSYATLVLGYLEDNMYQQANTIFGEEIGEYIKNNWLRYLDDCYINRIFTEDKLLQLHTLLNSLHSNIKFTMEKSRSQIPFLDILIKKDNKMFVTDIYYKTTDTQQYLDYTSNHPRHAKNNIPYNLARRICTIVDDHATKNRRLKELEKILQTRKYSKSLIETGINKA